MGMKRGLYSGIQEYSEMYRGVHVYLVFQGIQDINNNNSNNNNNSTILYTDGLHRVL